MCLYLGTEECWPFEVDAVPFCGLVDDAGGSELGESDPSTDAAFAVLIVEAILSMFGYL